MEEVVEQTVKKAYTAAKGEINTHRNWDIKDDSQGKVNHYKKTIKGLNLKIESMTNVEKF